MDQKDVSREAMGGAPTLEDRMVIRLGELQLFIRGELGVAEVDREKLTAQLERSKAKRFSMAVDVNQVLVDANESAVVRYTMELQSISDLKREFLQEMEKLRRAQQGMDVLGRRAAEMGGDLSSPRVPDLGPITPSPSDQVTENLRALLADLEGVQEFCMSFLEQTEGVSKDDLRVLSTQRTVIDMLIVALREGAGL